MWIERYDRLRRLLIAIVVGLGASVPAVATAGGYAQPDLGSVALSRGGAFVARADDPTAIYYNPAGAARLRGTHVLVDTHLLHESIFFQRRQYADPSVPVDNYPHPSMSDRKMPAIENDNAPAPAPFIAVTSDLGGWLRPARLVLLAGIYGPNAHPRRSYPRYCQPGTDPCVPAEDGLAAPQRYDAVGVEVLAIHPTIGLAWQPIDGLSIGAVALLSYVNFSNRAVVSALMSENPDTDIDIEFVADSGVTPTGMFGLHWQPLRWLELGASVRLGFTYKASGTLCVGSRQPDGTCDLPGTVKNELLGGTEITTRPNPAVVDLDLPESWVVRTGARYVDHDALGRERFDIELDFVWEQTSSLDAFTPVMREPVEVVFTRSGDLFKEISTISLAHRWQDSWSLRLGGAYRLHDVISDGELIFRAGGLYEAGAMRADHSRLDFLPMDRVGVAVGVGLRWRRYQLSLGYARLMHPPRDVAPAAGQPECSRTRTEDCGSRIPQVAPLVPSQFGTPVGNGRWELSSDQLTLGARVVLDQ